jgi:DNA-binding NtrC family response regulator
MVELPPLRRRREDLDLLTDHFLQSFARRFSMQRPTVSNDALELFASYDWPGNVRQLGNVLERASILANGGRIESDHLPAELRAGTDTEPGSGSDPRGGAGGDDDGTPDFSLRSAERDQIIRALDSAGGKRVQAARLLGLSRRTLYRKLEKYGIR